MFVQGITSAIIDKATSGANNIVVAVAGQTIYVWGWVLTTASATTITWKDGTTALTGAITTATGQPQYSAEVPEERPIWAVAGNLVLTLGGNVQCSGTVWYSIV